METPAADRVQPDGDSAEQPMAVDCDDEATAHLEDDGAVAAKMDAAGGEKAEEDEDVIDIPDMLTDTFEMEDDPVDADHYDVDEGSAEVASLVDDSEIDDGGEKGAEKVAPKPFNEIFLPTAQEDDLRLPFSLFFGERVAHLAPWGAQKKNLSVGKNRWCKAVVKQIASEVESYPAFRRPLVWGVATVTEEGSEYLGQDVPFFAQPVVWGYNGAKVGRLIKPKASRRPNIAIRQAYNNVSLS